MKGYAPTLKQKVWERDNYTCYYCGLKMKDSYLAWREKPGGKLKRIKDCKITVDHIIPRSKGGKLVEENLVTACTDCNRKKADKIVGVV